MSVEVAGMSRAKTGGPLKLAVPRGALLGETLELTVRASNRDCYAHGALTAAKFLAGKPIGMYSMNDVLGL